MFCMKTKHVIQYTRTVYTFQISYIYRMCKCIQIIKATVRLDALSLCYIQALHFVYHLYSSNFYKLYTSSVISLYCSSDFLNLLLLQVLFMLSIWKIKSIVISFVYNQNSQTPKLILDITQFPLKIVFIVFVSAITLK